MVARALLRPPDYQLSEPEDEDARTWQMLMLREARRVKEALEQSPSATFGLYPPEELRRFEARLLGESHELSVTRQEVIELLSERELYRALDECRLEVLRAAARERADQVDDVLLVGGSTLLPDVFARVAREFGRDRVRYWLPFEAVAYGAAIFAAGRVHTSDFILHDYALLTHDAKTGEPSHTVIIPRGTRFPTAMNLWERQLVPTCALGEPERFFKLVICEIGDGAGARAFGWDDAGNLHRLGGDATPSARPLLVELNAANPALGAVAEQNARQQQFFEQWLAAARAAGLEARQTAHDECRAHGLLEGVPVRARLKLQIGNKQQPHGSVLWVENADIPRNLALHGDSAIRSMSRWAGSEDVPIGDPDFDQRVELPVIDAASARP